jgi:hypothetical protein
LLTKHHHHQGIVCFDPLNIATRIQAQNFENENEKIKLLELENTPPILDKSGSTDLIDVCTDLNKSVSTDLIDSNRQSVSRFIPLTVYFSDDNVELSLNSDVNKDARNHGIVCTSSVIGSVL